MQKMEMKEVKIFSGTSNVELAEKIARKLDLALGDVQIVRFKDGEVYVRVDETVRGRDVFVIQPTSGPVNENLMELLIFIDALKRASAKTINVLLPYYGYARQERKSSPREPITAKLVANLLTTAGANRVVTMDLHADQIQGFFDIPVDHLQALPLLAKYFINKGLLLSIIAILQSSHSANFLALFTPPISGETTTTSSPVRPLLIKYFASNGNACK